MRWRDGLELVRWNLGEALLGEDAVGYCHFGPKGDVEFKTEQIVRWTISYIHPATRIPKSI